MYFSDIIGQELAKKELIGSFRKGLVPHARLFVGEDGAGAFALAYAYARYINCSAPNADDACGQCRSCLRFNSFAMQDILYLFPIVNDKSRNYCDDELPLWREFLAKGAYTRYNDWLDFFGGKNKSASIFAREGTKLMEQLSYQIDEAKYRVLFIWLPEKMHSSLANKLLKLTEEPPEGTIVLMVSQTEEEVLGTLLSRMQTLYLQPLSEEEIVFGLNKLQVKLPDGVTAEYVAHLAQGNFRNALDICKQKPNEGHRYNPVFKQLLRCTVNAQPLEMKALAEDLAKYSRDEQISILSYWAKMIRELFIYNFEEGELSYYDAVDEPILAYVKGCFDDDNVIFLTEEIELAIRHIGQNVNSRMVFFDLLLRFTSKMTANYKAFKVR